MLELAGNKVLIAEPIDGLEHTFAILKDMGCEMIIGPPVSEPGEGYSEDDLAGLCKEVDVAVGMARERFTRKVIEAGNRLRAICKYGNGVDNIDVKAASECGILVANAPVHNMTVAEYAFSMILALLKKIPRNQGYLKSGGWRDDSTMGNELYKKTVGIVGLGAIGKQLAQRLKGWEVKVIAYDPFVDRKTAVALDVELVSWEGLFSEADVITLHMPLSSETKGVVSHKEFGLMKDTSIIINTARGKIIDEGALIQALQEKKIAGAGIDVFENEPIRAGSPLLSMDNVVLTPHVAGYTEESLERIAVQTTRNCIQALKGQKPDFIVNKEAISLWQKRFA